MWFILIVVCFFFCTGCFFYAWMHKRCIDWAINNQYTEIDHKATIAVEKCERMEREYKRYGEDGNRQWRAISANTEVNKRLIAHVTKQNDRILALEKKHANTRTDSTD